MQTQKIIIDASSYSYVIVCTCGYRDVASSHHIAHAVAARHEAASHPETRQARRARERFLHRHADMRATTRHAIVSYPTPTSHV